MIKIGLVCSVCLLSSLQLYSLLYSCLQPRRLHTFYKHWMTYTCTHSFCTFMLCAKDIVRPNRACNRFLSTCNSSHGRTLLYSCCKRYTYVATDLVCSICAAYTLSIRLTQYLCRLKHASQVLPFLTLMFSQNVTCKHCLSKIKLLMQSVSQICQNMSSSALSAATHITLKPQKLFISWHDTIIWYKSMYSRPETPC